MPATYVDSYTKWKAELFSACLQNQMTHDIFVYFKSAAEMKSLQRPSRWWGKYSKLPNTVEHLWIIVQQQKKTTILGYKDTLFRL